MPPDPLLQIAWLGTYLRDEAKTRLVQVVGVEPNYLRCEDSVTEEEVKVRFDRLDQSWHVVRGGPE